MNLSLIIDGHPDDAPALISRGRVTAYGALRQQVASMRGALTRDGVGKGDVVALLCGNSRYFVVSYLAAIGIGAIVSPLNPTSPAPEIESELNVVKPTVAVVEPSAVAAWLQIPSDTRNAVRIVIATEGHDIAGARRNQRHCRGHPRGHRCALVAYPRPARLRRSGLEGKPRHRHAVPSHEGPAEA